MQDYLLENPIYSVSTIKAGCYPRRNTMEKFTMENN